MRLCKILPENFWFEVIIIFALILVNGFFSGSEIAVVSMRRSRMDQLAKEGKGWAAIINSWLKEPSSFLATIQIMITLAGAVASALGGALAIEHLKPAIQKSPLLSDWAEPLAIAIVVIPITYFSLVFGELVPKCIALSRKEKIGALVAHPIRLISQAARPAVYFLSRSTDLVLHLFGWRGTSKELFVSEEEIRFLIREGGSQGIFDQTEQQMIPKVFDFSDLRIQDVMIGREHISALDVTTPRDLLVTIVSEEGYTRLPVYRGNLDNIAGILHMKDLIHIINLGRIVILQDLVRPAVFVREDSLAKDLLKMFQKQRLHMALVKNAAGRTVGLVTLEDLIERIVGDIRDEHDAPKGELEA